MSKVGKDIEYGKKIYGAIRYMFNEDSAFHIDIRELSKEGNATAFVHAMATVAPNLMYGELTKDRKNNLEFNHMANQLVFQFSKMEE